MDVAFVAAHIEYSAYLLSMCAPSNMTVGLPRCITPQRNTVTTVNNTCQLQQEAICKEMRNDKPVRLGFKGSNHRHLFIVASHAGIADQG